MHMIVSRIYSVINHNFQGQAKHAVQKTADNCLYEYIRHITVTLYNFSLMDGAKKHNVQIHITVILQYCLDKLSQGVDTCMRIIQVVT